MRVDCSGSSAAASPGRTLHAAPLPLRVLAQYGATVGPDVRIASPLTVHNADRSFENLSVGAGAYIGRDCLLDLKDRIEIGARATLAMRVTIVTYVDVGRSSWATRYPASAAPVRIGADAYIGAG